MRPGRRPLSDGTLQVDLTNCDREPIHVLGAIQPIGFLIALTLDWMVARVSANVGSAIGRSDDLLGRPLGTVFTPAAVHDLRNRMAMLRGTDAVERMFDCTLVEGVPPFDIAIHLSGRQIVIEAQSASNEHGDATGAARSMIARLDQAKDFTSFFNEGARQVRALTGYDRVMVYRFSSNGSGEVVAEACKPGIGNFKGLHYPASDIPAQARELYKRNLLRVIADVDSTAVPITPVLDESGRPLDLSLSVLRSVSPIHIEYLKNMGVQASMSISILVDGELWGLFACHHYSPKSPSFERRAVCELFAQMFSMRLENRERKELVEYERRAREISDQLLGAVASDDTLLKDPDWLAEMLTRAIPADGIAVWLNGSYGFSGSTPSTKEFRTVVQALNATAAGRVFATDCIGSIVPGAADFVSSAAGMLAIPISRTPRDYVVLFRSEMVRSVRWAGDPHKPTAYGPNGPRLSPRESFAEWKQLVQGKSLPFTDSELRVAETLRATLIEVVLRLASEANVERQRANERQELLIAELNHRVRNILGVIRGLIRQAKPGSDNIEDFVRQVDGRIHALARAHNQITDDHWGPAPIRALIEAEAAAFLTDENARITIEGEPILLNPQAYSTMALVIHELVTNSTKYGSLSASGFVRIAWHRNETGDLIFDWEEHGGPPVKQPTRKGFGTTIVQRSVPYDLGGHAKVDYEESGLRARFCIPARHVSVGSKEGTARLRSMRTTLGHRPEPPGRILEGRRVLLVEDSLIIALDAEDILLKLGATVASASTVADALDLIETERPSFAMLDINLGERTSMDVADRLRTSGVPFLFATGYGEQAKLPPVHRGRFVLQKPYTMDGVARAVSTLLDAETP